MPQKKLARQKLARQKSGRQRSASWNATGQKSGSSASVGESAGALKSPADETDYSSDDVFAENSESEQKPVADLLQAARNGAIRLLARREHSRTELRNKLLLRSHPAEIIDPVLDRLAEQGLQSDQRFAESYTRMRSRRGYGGNKIRAELMSRDVDRDTIAAAIASTEECWIENASAILAKKYPKFSITNSNTSEQAKMHRFLWSRGYNSEQVKLAIQRLRK